jgi:intracellular sulfur oxidation DsrE/DsrF family protein
MPILRRNLLNRGLLAAAFSPVTAAAAAETGAAAMSEPQDAWYDEGGRRHRMVFDTISVDGLGMGLAFARNFYTANREGYGIDAKDLSTLIIVRHMSTVFGFNDTIWAQYGEATAERLKLIDPRTKAAPKVNLFNTELKGERLPNNGILISDLTKLGTRFAVCGMAAARFADTASKTANRKAEDILAEIKANLIPNAVMVPGGIVALNRAQEHGYTFANCG